MSEWVTKQLGALVDFQKGRKVDTSPFRLAGYERYLGAGSLAGDHDGYASAFLAVQSSEKDVLMLWDGERSGLVGHNLAGIVSSTVSRLTPNDKITSSLLYYYLLFNFEWIQNRRTGTGVPHVPKDLAKILRLKYPVDEKYQKKLATILATIDQAIEKTEALIHKYQQIKAGLMHDLFSRGLTADGKLRPPREQAPEMYQETPIGWIPSEWGCGPLSKYLNGSPKNGYSPREIDEWDGCYALGLGCLTVSGFRAIQLKYVSERVALASGALLRDGDFLISRANTPQLVGLCGIYQDVGALCIYPDLIMRINLNERIYSQFLEQYLLSAGVRIRLTALAVGTSSSMVKLNSKSLLNFFVAVPRKKEQKLIIQRLDKIINYLNKLNDELEKLKQEKSGLMHDLLTGKVQVKIDQKETAHD